MNIGVEQAIDLAKSDRKSTWGELLKRLRERKPPKDPEREGYRKGRRDGYEFGYLNGQVLMKQRAAKEVASAVREGRDAVEAIRCLLPDAPELET